MTKMQPEPWYHVAFLDGTEIYRGLARPDVERIKKDFNCGLEKEPFARRKKPEIIYFFTTYRKMV